MKKLLLLLTIILTASVNSQVNYFENDVRVINSTSQITMTHYGESEVTDKFGFTDYIFVTNNGALGYWGEVLIGPYIKPTEDLLVGVYAGIETGTTKARFATIASYNINARTNFYVFYEYGQNEAGGDDYYDYHLKYTLTDNQKTKTYVALRYRQGYGFGLPLGISRNFKDSNKSYHLYFTGYYNSDTLITGTGVGKSNWIPTLSFNLNL